MAHPRFECLALMILAASAALTSAPLVPAASAAVDLNGLWRASVFLTQPALSFDADCSLTVVQNQTSLSITGPCQGVAPPVSLAGTIDPAAGSFTANGSAGPCPMLSVSGTVLPDGTRFTGEFTCSSVAGSGGLNARRCGNGQLDPGETCDDGNVADTDCCWSNCALANAGWPCPDDGLACTRDRCDGTGQCQHAVLTGACNDANGCTMNDTCIDGQCVGTLRPDDSACNDGNACTIGDRCVAGTCTAQPVACPACFSCNVTLGCVATITTGCKEAPRSSIVLRRHGTATVDWQWKGGEATHQSELGDPTTTTDYDFCVYDGDVDAAGRPGVVLASRAPAGGDWRPWASGAAYRRTDFVSDGVRRIRVKSGATGKTRASAEGHGPNLVLQPLQSIAMPVAVQLKSSEGTCWSAVYGAATARLSSAFKAKRTRRAALNQPNLLLIQLDDTRADGVDRMPTLAQLAAQGVTFTNSFVVDPLCAPSRASLLSGLFASHHAVRVVGGGAAAFRASGADRQTIAVWLQAAGYRTGLFGKYVNGYGFGATEQTGGPGGTYYVPPGWSRWRGMTSGEHYGGIRGPTYRLVDERGRVTVYDDHSSDRQYSTDLLGAELRAFVSDAVENDRPFFAMWTPYASHVDTPFFIPNSAARHFRFFAGLQPWHPASWSELDMTDKPRWLQLAFSSSPGDPLDAYNEAVRQSAYESLLPVDEQLRLLLGDLVQLGVDRDTVILVTSDNGVGWGEHRIFLQGKECPYEECLRVPMVVYDPRHASQGMVSEAAVLNIDVAPTVAALAGVVPPVPLDGTSFAPWITQEPVTQWREDFLLEHWRTNRDDGLSYTGQPNDGDRLRFLYGDTTLSPRPSVLFEFDSAGGVGGGAVTVAIGSTADATFAALATAISTAVPSATASHFPDRDELRIVDTSAARHGIYLVIERDQAAVIVHTYGLGDYFGVRDVANGFTYVEHESGEVELYDLTADPAQLTNQAGNPAYAETQARLAQRLDALLP